MANAKPNPKIAKEYKKMVTRDVAIALLMLVPIGYIVYCVFNWPCVSRNGTLFGLMIFAIILVISNVIMEFVNWRCPKCHRYIGMCYYPRFCPRCGERFR